MKKVLERIGLSKLDQKAVIKREVSCKTINHTLNQIYQYGDEICTAANNNFKRPEKCYNVSGQNFLDQLCLSFHTSSLTDQMPNSGVNQFYMQPACTNRQLLSNLVRYQSSICFRQLVSNNFTASKAFFRPLKGEKKPKPTLVKPDARLYQDVFWHFMVFLSRQKSKTLLVITCSWGWENRTPVLGCHQLYC